MSTIDPDSEENQAQTRENHAEVKRLQMKPSEEAIRAATPAERLAQFIYREESLKCKKLDDAVFHQSNWRRAIPEAQRMIDAAFPAIDESTAKLRAENEADTKRLDFLEMGLRHTDPKNQLIKIDRGWKEPLIEVKTYNGRTTSTHSEDTLRAAIDAAMKGRSFITG